LRRLGELKGARGVGMRGEWRDRRVEGEGGD